MKKINIDECYLALISSYIGYESKTDEVIQTYFKKVKFTIVKYIECGHFQDIISDEFYKENVSKLSPIGELVVNKNYFLLPLSSLINSKDNLVRKKRLLEAVRNPLIELTNLLYSEDKYKLNSVKTIENAFKDIELNKPKRGINTEKLYIASLREVTNVKYDVNFFNYIKHCNHKHNNFVIVKQCPFHKGKFKDLRFGNVYKNLENCNYAELGIEERCIWSFNYMTGNKQKRLSYTKVLNLFHETSDKLTKEHNL